MLLHDVKDFPVQNLGGIEAQHEIHVVPVGNQLVVEQVPDLGQEEGGVPGVSQAVQPRAPDGRGHLHVPHVVERRPRLRGWRRGFINKRRCWGAPSGAPCKRDCCSLGMEGRKNWISFLLWRRETSIKMQSGLVHYSLVSEFS